MGKLVLLFCACLLHLRCIDKGQASSEQWVAAIQLASAPILWTVDYSPDGKFYAVGGNDSLLKVFEANGHKLLYSFKMPASVQCLDWHADSRLLAVAVADHPVQILDIVTATFQHLSGTTGSRALDWNNDGKLLVVGDYENTLQIWSKEGRLLRTIEKGDNKSYLSVEWHPSENVILTGSDKIRIFDTTGKLLQSIKHRREETPVLTVRWHPSGKFFATGDYGEPENGIESLLQFWDANGELIGTMHGSKAEYRNVRWNRSGEVLATASDALRLWLKTGQVIYSGSSEDLLWGIDWDPQDQGILTSSKEGRINLWTNKAELLKHLER
jgi:WD40 repeat protein